jgi:sulfur transfer complex TusBCD TusB component (DsrH family)
MQVQIEVIVIYDGITHSAQDKRATSTVTQTTIACFARSINLVAQSINCTTHIHSTAVLFNRRAKNELDDVKEFK